MLAVGVTGIYAFHGIRESVRDNFAGDHPTKIDDYLYFTPAAAYLGLGFIPGMPCRSDFYSRLMAGTTAYAVMTAAECGMKFAFRERRPDSSQRNSFPSGHTATAFTGAELMRIEYGNLTGLAGYAVAIAVGALRIYDNRHWINDVIGGAAVGILSARVGYWLLPYERRLFGLDKKDSHTSVAVVPSGMGLAVAVTF